MALEYSIRLAGSVLCEGRPADPDNCVLLQKVSGLDGRERRMQTEAAAGADGDVFGPATRSGINLVLEAIIVGSSTAALRTKEKALREVLEPGDAAGTMLVEVLGRSGDPVGGLRAQMRVVAPLRAPDDASDGRAKPATWALACEPAYWLGPTDLTTAVTPLSIGGGLTFGTPPSGIYRVMTFPIDFGASTEAGTSVTNAGDARVWPVLRLYGATFAPILENLATGDRLTFPALTIAAGDYVEIRTAPGARAVLLNGTSSIYSTLDRSASSWWPLVPGVNPIRLTDSSHDASARLDVIYTDGYV